MSSSLQVKVLTSSGNTNIATGIEQAYTAWLEEASREGTVDIYNVAQSECAISSSPHITLTIFYKITT